MNVKQYFDKQTSPDGKVMYMLQTEVSGVPKYASMLIDRGSIARLKLYKFVEYKNDVPVFKAPSY